MEWIRGIDGTTNLKFVAEFLRMIVSFPEHAARALIYSSKITTKFVWMIKVFFWLSRRNCHAMHFEINPIDFVSHSRLKSTKATFRNQIGLDAYKPLSFGLSLSKSWSWENNEFPQQYWLSGVLFDGQSIKEHLWGWWTEKYISLSRFPISEYLITGTLSWTGSSADTTVRVSLNLCWTYIAR